MLKGEFIEPAVVKMKSYLFFERCISLFVVMSLFALAGCGEEEEPVEESVKKTELTESGKIGEYAYVDLGLSVKWATYNVGAKKITERGDLFAWGETDAKDSYVTRENSETITYKYFVETGLEYPSVYATKYNTDPTSVYYDNKSVLEKEDDAASFIWGDSWRTPTFDEFNELMENTDEVVEKNYEGSGVTCLVLTSKVNGNKIIFPMDTHSNFFGTEEITNMSCWTSTKSSETDVDWRAYVFTNSSNYLDWSRDTRDHRHTVRAVSK